MRENDPVSESASLLGSRYASAEMRAIFAPSAKIIQERKLWIAVMRAQSTLGHAIDAKVIADYEKVITKVDLASIDAREKATRHDVKARIEEFNALAGHEAIHAGMTSRDLTENIEALQVRDGLNIVHDKVVAVLAALGYPADPIAGGEITNLPEVTDTQIFHAGTKSEGTRLLSSGGRVLTVTGIGSDLTEARNQAYRAISQINLTNSFYRSDIALNASVAEKGN